MSHFLQWCYSFILQLHYTGVYQVPSSQEKCHVSCGISQVRQRLALFAIVYPQSLSCDKAQLYVYFTMVLYKFISSRHVIVGTLHISYIWTPKKKVFGCEMELVHLVSYRLKCASKFPRPVSSSHDPTTKILVFPSQYSLRMPKMKIMPIMSSHLPHCSTTSHQRLV